MPGKKRKLKKELKRKLRKDIKNKENKRTKVDKSKVEKQDIDNQTLQQIMMAQMMNSRDRIRRGEDTSWITTQNQANADRIQAQQKINALKAEKQEWERKAKNVEENEKYKELIEKLNQEIEDKKKAVERAQKLIPLEKQVRELEAQKVELEQKLHDPLTQKQLEIEAVQNYIKHMKTQLDTKDPEHKKTSEKIAKKELKLKRLKDQQQLIEEYDRVDTELNSKRSEMKTMFNYIREKAPDFLKGVQWNANNINEIIQKLIDNTVSEIVKNETTLKKYKEQQQIGEEYNKVALEFKRKEAEMKADMENIRQQIPNFLTGVQWNSKDRDEKILEAKHKAAMERDNMNKQLEILKETSEEMKALNQVKADRDIYKENFKKKHPLFNPIYEKNLLDYGENRTPADETQALIVSYLEYKTQMKANINTMSEIDKKLDKLKSDESDESDESDKSDESDESGYEKYRMSSTISDDESYKAPSDDSYIDLEESDNSEDKQLTEGQSILRKDGGENIFIGDSEANMTQDGAIKKKKL